MTQRTKQRCLVNGKKHFYNESQQVLDYIYQHYSPKGSL